MARRRLISILAAFVMTAAVAARGRATAQEQPAPAADDAALEQAEENQKQAIVAARKLGPDHTGELAAAFAGLADFYVNQQRMTEASAILDQALVLLAETPRADFRVLDQVYQTLATVRLSQKNKAEAETLLQRSIALRERRLGPNHLDVADALDRLAELNSWGDEETALELHERAFAIRDRHFSANPVEAIAWLKRDAEWRARQIVKEENGVAAIWKRVLALQERTLGPEHRDVADTLMNIAAVRVRVNESGGLLMPMHLDLTKDNLFPTAATQADWQKSAQAWARDAEPLLERARAIREKTLGPDHPDTIKTLEYLAAGYGLRHDPTHAVPLYQRIVAARERTGKADDASLKRPLAALAVYAMEEHRYRDAIPLLKRLADFEAKEEARKPKDGGPFGEVIQAIHDRNEPEDDRSYAAQLRKATRYADLELTGASLPTQEDLAFLKAERWCATRLDLDGLTKLTAITAYGKHVDNTALGHLKGLINLTHLSVVPGGKRAMIFADEPQHDMYTVDVSQGLVKPNIDDVGLAQLRNLTVLEELNLSGTAIHGAGLAVLARMNGLRELDLSSSLVDDAGLASLPVLPKLQRLDLSLTAVSDASLPVLKKLTGLTRVVIIGTKLSKEGVAELRRAIPGLEVVGPVYRPAASSADETK